MVLNDFDYLISAARAVQKQAMDNPNVGIPVDPDVAEFMGAMYDSALDDVDMSADDSQLDVPIMQNMQELTERGSYEA